MRLNETELLEIEERADLASRELDDPEVSRRYADRAAKVDVPRLIEALRRTWEESGGGGDLGLMLRNALKARILQSAPTLSDDDKRIATLAEDVKIHSMQVAAVRGQGRVIVDVRLMVGDQPVVD